MTSYGLRRATVYESTEKESALETSVIASRCLTLSPTGRRPLRDRVSSCRRAILNFFVGA
jgi:hypothetical protein